MGENRYLRAMQETLWLRNTVIGYRGHRTNHRVAGPLEASLRQGELTCLLGSNGTGKSTLLRTLVGQLPTLAGDILLGKEEEWVDLKTFSPRQLAKRIGVVLTERMESSQLTVSEVVEMGRQPYTGFWGKLSPNDKHVAEEAMKEVGVARLAQRKLDSLSDGERQKTMIAKALAQSTPIILLDEPTAFLDFPSKVELLQLLRRLAHEEGKTIMLSTHDLELALRLGDRLWLLDQERNLKTGTPRQLADSGDLARYIERGNLSFDNQNLSISLSR